MLRKNHSKIRQKDTYSSIDIGTPSFVPLSPVQMASEFGFQDTVHFILHLRSIRARAIEILIQDVKYWIECYQNELENPSHNWISYLYSSTSKDFTTVKMQVRFSEDFESQWCYLAYLCHYAWVLKKFTGSKELMSVVRKFDFNGDMVAENFQKYMWVAEQEWRENEEKWVKEIGGILED